MLSFLARQWFLVSLAILIVAGFAFGLTGLGPQAQSVSSRIDPKTTTAVVLFLMSFTLDSRSLVAAVKAPRAVLLAIVINAVFMPLAGCLAMRGQLSADFACGVMIAMSVPSTLASASVMTRKAGGQDAISLLVTVITNGLCFLTTPFWLYVGTSQKLQLDLKSLSWGLIVAVLIPTAAGQVARFNGPLREFANRCKPWLGAAAQICIELIVFSAAVRGGMTWNELTSTAAVTSAPVVIEPINVQSRDVVDGSSTAAAIAAETLEQAERVGASNGVSEHAGKITGSAVLVMVATVLGLHLIAWWLSLRVADWIRLPRHEGVAVSFSASEKTLPVGLLVAADPATFGTAFPFALFPMLIYHIGQLFMDSALASWLKMQSERKIDRERV